MTELHDDLAGDEYIEGEGENDMRSIGIRAAAAMIAIALFAAPVVAEEEVAPPRGHPEFIRYCASCHGIDGRGHGPMTDSLKSAPPDLTRLNERYGTPLNRGKLAGTLDGRRPMASHGSREMPVWGKQLHSDVPLRTPEVEKRNTISLIMDYLQSIQSSAEPEAP